MRPIFTYTVTPQESRETNGNQEETDRLGKSTRESFWRLKVLPKNPVTQVD